MVGNGGRGNAEPFGQPLPAVLLLGDKDELSSSIGDFRKMARSACRRWSDGVVYILWNKL
ncbi:hypothetical protein DQX05_17010 [Paenibacillus thiaminolyticus]|uniref:Uncharacterized protein n=1 Tax=Paenibacillus thiaminolyticus TaxID=49283 RepID=A0A3A3GH93_PANTH|nr:hypothetical protein DQX05_17010 [Paenibacillus thiaminolyticus]